jgi:hypothetical protein
MGGVLRQPGHDRQRGCDTMTARKTTPHLKRGPKPKPKLPKRSKGRPAGSLREHPDRYAVARFDVADRWLKSMVKGNRLRAGMVLGVDMARQRQDAAAMRKAADRFRTMARRYGKPADMEWRKAIGTAVAFALLTAADPITNPNELAIICSVITDQAASVGEEEWARRELLPLIALRLPFKLEDRDLLTVLSSAVVTIGWVTEINQWMEARRVGDDAQTAQPEIAGIFCPT